MLLFNITDMLEARKRSAERVNKLFGVNWSVDVSPEINYQEKTLTIGEENNNEKAI